MEVQSCLIPSCYIRIQAPFSSDVQWKHFHFVDLSSLRYSFFPPLKYELLCLTHRRTYEYVSVSVCVSLSLSIYKWMNCLLRMSLCSHFFSSPKFRKCLQVCSKIPQSACRMCVLLRKASQNKRHIIASNTWHSFAFHREAVELEPSGRKEESFQKVNLPRNGLSWSMVHLGCRWMDSLFY